MYIGIVVSLQIIAYGEGGGKYEASLNTFYFGCGFDKEIRLYGLDRLDALRPTTYCKNHVGLSVVPALWIQMSCHILFKTTYTFSKVEQL